MDATIDEATVRQTAKRCFGLAARCIALEATAATMRQAVDEIAQATGVPLAIEGAVWHRADGQTDRACWVVKGTEQ